MAYPKLGDVQARFADIIWKNEPLSSRALVEICKIELGWKRTTTYTVLKQLCDKGLFQNTSSTVSALMSKEEFESVLCIQFVDETFDGSLASFLSAYATKRTLSDMDVAEIRKMITLQKSETI